MFEYILCCKTIKRGKLLTNLYTGTYRNVLMSVMGENTHGEPLGGGAHTHKNGTLTFTVHMVLYCT